MLTRLKTKYGKVTMEMKDKNTRLMAAAWQPPTPIDTLFQQLGDGVYFAAAGAEPLVDTTVACMGYNIIAATGLFTEAYHDWCLLDPAAQTFAAIQYHFRCMDNYRRLTSIISASAGYQAAHHSIAPSPNAASVTSSLSSDASVLAAKIVLLRAQLALAVIALPVAICSTRAPHAPPPQQAIKLLPPIAIIWMAAPRATVAPQPAPWPRRSPDPGGRLHSLLKSN